MVLAFKMCVFFKPPMAVFASWPASETQPQDLNSLVLKHSYCISKHLLILVSA